MIIEFKSNHCKFLKRRERDQDLDRGIRKN